VTLVLASTSPYRRELLARLGLDFETFRPEVDESRLPDEPAVALVTRLAIAKAEAAKRGFGDGLAIGSDQVVALGDEVLGKPGDRARAIVQLEHLSGRSVAFLTAVAVCNLADGHVATDLARTTVRFRELDRATIERYLDREPALDCAGAFKSEGLGISLVEGIDEDDPTALIGLPLVRLCRLLRGFGLELP
jgi:septum formation protein